MINENDKENLMLFEEYSQQTQSAYYVCSLDPLILEHLDYEAYTDHTDHLSR